LLIFLQNLHGGMHPIEILEDLIGLIPVFQRLSQEKFLQKLNPTKFLCFFCIPKETSFLYVSTTPHPVHTMPGFLMLGRHVIHQTETPMTQPLPKNVVRGSLVAPSQKVRLGSTILSSVAQRRRFDCMPCLIASDNRIRILKNVYRIQPPPGAFAQQISPDSALLGDLQASYLTIRP
jgi:hypothetical protein